MTIPVRWLYQHEFWNFKNVGLGDGGGGDMIGIKGEGVRKGGVGGGGLIGVMVRTGHSPVSKNSGYNCYYDMNSEFS